MDLGYKKQMRDGFEKRQTNAMRTPPPRPGRWDPRAGGYGGGYDEGCANVYVTGYYAIKYYEVGYYDIELYEVEKGEVGCPSPANYWPT